MEEICQQNVADCEEAEHSLLSYKMKHSPLKYQPQLLLSTRPNPKNKLLQQKIEKNTTIKSFICQMGSNATQSTLKQNFSNVFTLECQGSVLYSQISEKRRMTGFQNKQQSRMKRKSRFFTPQKQISLTYKFVKVIRNNQAIGSVVFQDKTSSIAELMGKGFLCLSDGTKIKGEWSGGEAVGQLAVCSNRGYNKEEEQSLLNSQMQRFTLENSSKFKLSRADPALAVDCRYQEQLIELIRRNSEQRRRLLDFFGY